MTKALLIDTPIFDNPPGANGVILFDAETQYHRLQQSVTVLGWHCMGEKCVRQAIFPTPCPTHEVAASDFFVGTFLRPGVRLGAYNASFEANLFNVPVEIEVMPRAYAAKERYIQVESLSTERGGELPPWTPTTMPEVCFHNLSCVVKLALLYLGLHTYAHPTYPVKYEEALRLATQ